MRPFLRRAAVAAGPIHEPVPGPGHRHRRKVPVAVRGHLAVSREQLEEDGASGTCEPGHVDRPVDRDLLDLLPEEAGFPFAQAQPEARVLLDPAAQSVLPPRYMHTAARGVFACFAHSIRRRYFRRKAKIINAAKKVGSQPRSHCGPKESTSSLGRPSCTRSTGESSGK